MNIEFIIEKLVQMAEKITLYIQHNNSEIIAYVSAGIVYLNVMAEVLHMGFTVATAILSFISVKAIKWLMENKDILQTKDKKDDEKEG